MDPPNLVLMRVEYLEFVVSNGVYVGCDDVDGRLGRPHQVWASNVARLHHASVHLGDLVIERILLRIKRLSLAEPIWCSEATPRHEWNRSTARVLQRMHASRLLGHVETVSLRQVRNLVGLGMDLAQRTLRQVLQIALGRHVHRFVQGTRNRVKHILRIRISLERLGVDGGVLVQAELRPVLCVLRSR